MQTTKNTNVRFWQWHNDGWVKLTLRPGQELSHTVSGGTEEGYRSEWTTWSYDGDQGVVYLIESSRERDCDGLYDSHAEYACNVTDVAKWESAVFDPNEETHKTPVWQRFECGQRDYTAESMNY